MRRYLVWSVSIVTAVALTGSLVSCGFNQTTTQTPEPSETSLDVSPSPAAFEPPCTAAFPVTLAFKHDTAAEAAAAVGLFACASADGSQTHIINDSQYVWIAPEFRWTTEASNLQTQAFRDGIAAQLKALAMEPGAEATFDVAPETLYITVSEQALGAWNAVVLATSVAEDRLSSVVTKTVSGNSKIRAALSECAASGFSAAKSVSEAGNAKSAFENYLSNLELASGVGSCAGAVDEYISESRPKVAVPAATVDDVLAHGRAPAFVLAREQPLYKSALARIAIQVSKVVVRVVR